jgi:hypothetical protein
LQLGVELRALKKASSVGVPPPLKQERRHSPLFLNPKLLQLLPKLANLELGSIVLINRSINTRTSSFVANSSAVGKRGSTKLKREVERSVRYCRVERA